MTVAMFQDPQKRAIRRAVPIMGYVGANGGGKSAAMVWDTLPSLKAGRPVLSTVRLLDWENPRDCRGCDDPGHEQPIYGPIRVEDLAAAAIGDPEARHRLYLESQLEDGAVIEDFSTWDQRVLDRAPLITHDEHGFPIREVLGYKIHKAAHPLYVPFREWPQLLASRKCDVLMDEVTGVASSRESQSMPSVVANQLVQLRRADVTVRWSAPDWARADKIIRECSQGVTYCRGSFAKRVGTPGETDRQWRQRRLFAWKTYDAAAFENFTSGKREALQAQVRDLHWGPKSPVFQAYDTYDAVLSIGTVSESGRCYRCGGTRQNPKCQCPDHAGASGQAAREGRPEQRSARAARGRLQERSRGLASASDAAGLVTVPELVPSD